MRSRVRSGAVTATLTATALVLALGLASCGSNHHQTVPPTVPTTSAPPSSTTQPDTGPYDWTRAASPALALGGGASSTLAAIVTPVGGSPWIVAGTRTAPDGSSTATIWTSADGGSWSSTALTGPDVDSQAEAATTWRTGTVIVGSVGQGARRQAAVWMAPSPGAPFAEMSATSVPAGESVMTAVAGGTLGLVAAGTANGHVALWYSSTGARWTALNAADRVIAGADDPHIDTLLATDDGVFAGGWDRSGPSVVAAVWTSGDGINWHPVLSAEAAFGGPGGHLITALAPLGTGIVAVGGSRTGTRWSPASWISPNGASWSEPSTAFALGVRPQPDAADAIVRALDAIPTLSTNPALAQTVQLVAVGGGPTAQRMWESTDGLHWTEQALPPEAAISDDWRASLLGVAGSTTVVADSDAGQPHLLVRRATEWQEPSANPDVFGAVQSVARAAGLISSTAGLTLAVDINQPSQALGHNGSSTEFLTSGDGTTWIPVATSAVFAGGTIEGLAAKGTGLVAVGSVAVPGGERAVAWTSLDGRVWRPAAALDPRPVAGSDQANAVCTSASSEIAVGSVRSSRGVDVARAWVSNDGVHWVVASVAPPGRAGTAAAMSGCTAASLASPGGSVPTSTTFAGGSETGGRTGATTTSVPRPGASSTGGVTGFDAFGTADAPAATPAPAFWVSVHGTQWTQQTASPFGAGFPFPAVDVARSGQVWMATSGGAASDLGWAGPASIIPAAPSGLWRTTDGGANWQQLDTTGAAWQGDEPAQIDRVALLGGMPVVAGQVDGRLAVWVGTPT
jgi:hypothetical protein